MATAKEQFDEAVNSYLQTENINLEEAIKKGKEFITFLSDELQKHTYFVDQLEQIQSLRILTLREEEEAPNHTYSPELATQSNKRIKKILKKFFRENQQFKRVPERKVCNAILMLNPDDLKNYHMFINDDSNEEIKKWST